jgi:hypothetical protein
MATADAPGTATPERLASTGPDMAAWVDDLVSDTDGSGASAEAATASVDTGQPTQDDTTALTESEDIPTPAEETTAISATQGKDWIKVNGEKSCPPEFPIKGNATSRIYHLPGGPTYEATIPEFCFANEEAAVGLGYRPRKR